MSEVHIHGHDEVLREPPRLQEVADGIYAYLQPDWTWMINNTGFLVGPDGVTVVDTCGTEPRTRAFIKSAQTISDKPLRTLINTHHHGDHTYGNWLLPNATIIGHEKCRQEAIETGTSLRMVFRPLILARLKSSRLSSLLRSASTFTWATSSWKCSTLARRTLPMIQWCGCQSVRCFLRAT